MRDQRRGAVGIRVRVIKHVEVMSQPRKPGQSLQGPVPSGRRFFLRHGMPALSHAPGHAFDGEFRRTQPDIDEIEQPAFTGVARPAADICPCSTPSPRRPIRRPRANDFGEHPLRSLQIGALQHRVASPRNSQTPGPPPDSLRQPLLPVLGREAPRRCPCSRRREELQEC